MLKNVTNDLAIGLRISLETAEKIKLVLSKENKKKKSKEEGEDDLDLKTLGITDVKKISRKTLVEGIIRPRLNEIFAMVRIQLEREGLATKVPSGAIITGGGAETVGISESARRTLALPIRVGTPKGVAGLIDDIMTPQFSVPVGLILYGVNQGVASSSNTGKTSKFKMPGKGIASKLIDMVKDLLP